MFVRYNGIKYSVKKYLAVNMDTGEIVTVKRISLPKDQNDDNKGDWAFLDENDCWDRSAYFDDWYFLRDNSGNKYDIIECVYDAVEIWSDDNFSDFELFGTQMIETAGRYTRKTVKQGDKTLCEIYCTLPSGSIMYFDGRFAEYISDNHEWDLVSIS